MKLSPEKISRLMWSTFKDSVVEGDYRLPNSMQNVLDIIMGDAVENVASVYVMFNKTGTVEFAHLQIGIRMESNTIDTYDSIDFDDNGNVVYGNKTNSVTFPFHEIRTAWLSVFN